MILTFFFQHPQALSKGIDKPVMKINTSPELKQPTLPDKSFDFFRCDQTVDLLIIKWCY